MIRQLTISLIIISITTVCYGDGSQEAATLASQVMGAIHSSVTDEGQQQVMSNLGVQATPIGSESSVQVDDMGVSGTRAANFTFSLKPNCHGSTRITTLDGIVFKIGCQAMSAGIDTNVCVPNKDNDCTQASNFVGFLLPTAGDVNSLLTYQVSARCKEGLCTGTISQKGMTTGNSGNLAEQATTAAASSDVYDMVSSGYLGKDGYSNTQAYMNSFSAKGSNNIFANCVNGVQGVFKDGVYYSCDGHESDTFAGCHTQKTCTAYDFKEHSQTSTRTCTESSGSQNITCDKTAQVTATKKPLPRCYHIEGDPRSYHIVSGSKNGMCVDDFYTTGPVDGGADTNKTITRAVTVPKGQTAYLVLQGYTQGPDSTTQIFGTASVQGVKISVNNSHKSAKIAFTPTSNTVTPTFHYETHRHQRYVVTQVDGYVLFKDTPLVDVKVDWQENCPRINTSTLLTSLGLGDDVPQGCKDPTTPVCVDGQATRTINGVPVTLDCWKYHTGYTCPDWSKITNSCNDEPDCKATGSPTVVSPWQKQQNMTCTKQWYTKECSDYQTKQVCDQGNYTQGNDQYISPTDTGSFGDMVGYMGMLDSIEHNINGQLQIFGGKIEHCNHPFKLGPLNMNCCNRNLHTHRDHWYNLNSCSSSEAELALAKRNGATHYLGRYCDSWAPFHFFCKKHIEGYCQFPTMLSRIIQDKGREQINALAEQGSKTHNAATQHVNWKSQDTTAHWQSIDVGGITVALYAKAKPTVDSAPIGIYYQNPLLVRNGGNNSITGVSASLNCQLGMCTGAFVSNSQNYNFVFDPTCQLQGAQTWSVGGSIIEQNRCLTPGDQSPADWQGKLTWDDKTPSLWQFAVDAKSVTDVGGSRDVHVTLPQGILTGTGGCSGQSCQYHLTLDGKTSQSGDLSFPLNCSDASSHVVKLGDVTIGPLCNAKLQEFAVCTKGTTCGDLPAPSDFDKDNGSSTNGWQLSSQPQSLNTFISSDIKVQGSCSGDDCRYTITSLGVNGIENMLRSNLTWNLYTAPIQNGVPQEDYTDASMALVTPSNISVRPFRYQSDDQPKDQVKMLVKLPSSKTWDSFTVPVSIDQSHPVQLYASPKVVLSGGCDTSTGKCSYNLFAQTHINAMPWGDAHHPNCEGFTPEQLMLINFNKIDLSEYINSLGRQMSDQQKQEMAQQAKDQMGDFAGNLSSGGSEINQPSSQQGQKVVTVTPLSGQGADDDSFKVELRANVNFPNYIPYGQCGYPAEDHNNNLISGIDIDWGDGAKTTMSSGQIKTASLSGVNYGNTGACTYQIPLYMIDHVYHTPSNQTQLVPITVTLHTSDGDHKTVINIENQWNQTDHNNQTGGGFSDTGPSYKVNQYSDGVSFDAQTTPGLEQSG